MQNVKVVMIGDGGIGKTCALLTFANGNYPDHDPDPTVFDNYRRGTPPLFLASRQNKLDFAFASQRQPAN